MQLLLRDTYLAMIRNSVGSNLFRTLYAEVDGTKKDILDDGGLSCAFFVSMILHHFKLLQGPHATVSGTVRDLEASGWQKTEAITPGAVLVWEKLAQASEELHDHIGFARGEEKAISNWYMDKVPVEHHLTFDGTRKITAVYTHPFLQ
jgi:hypothetical protein